jgi:hypothetical protein
MIIELSLHFRPLSLPTLELTFSNANPRQLTIKVFIRNYYSNSIDFFILAFI